MCVCVHVCMCACVFVYVCMCSCVHECVFMCTWVCVYVNVSVCAYERVRERELAIIICSSAPIFLCIGRLPKTVYDEKWWESHARLINAPNPGSFKEKKEIIGSQMGHTKNIKKTRLVVTWIPWPRIKPRYIDIKVGHYLFFMLSPPKISYAIWEIRNICLHLLTVFYVTHAAIQWSSFSYFDLFYVP